MAYYTLLQRFERPADYDEPAMPYWAIEFGDYDCETVELERDHYRDTGVPAKHLRIVKTRTARQSEIDRLVASLPVTEGSR